jgi:site-specific recombinase XerD
MKKQIDELVREWITYSDVTEQSRKEYKISILVWFQFLATIGVKPENAVKADTRRYKTYLSGKYAATSVNRHLSSVRLFYDYLRNNDYVTENITEGLRNVKVGPQIRKEALTAEQAATLLNSINRYTLDGKRDYAIISLMIVTGIRRVEVYRLDESDVIADRSMLHIRRKGASEKIWMKIPEDLMNTIVDYAMCKEDLPYRDSALFVTHMVQYKCGRLSLYSISDMVNKRLKSIGLDTKYYTCHSLRHTAATLASDAGIPDTEISNMLGHSNLKTTSIYLQALRRHMSSGNAGIISNNKTLLEAMRTLKSGRKTEACQEPSLST